MINHWNKLGLSCANNVLTVVQPMSFSKSEEKIRSYLGVVRQQQAGESGQLKVIFRSESSSITRTTD